jgi:hypothetical protein
MTDQPQQLAVGSLEDDQLELARLLVDPARASSVDLDRAAAMLHFLSDVLCGWAS